jgi:hypothetical protein
MEATRQLPGMQRLLWVRNAALRTGILTGIYASCIFVGWLLAANHIRRLEPFAGIRNLVAGAVMIFLLSIPLLRFRHEPAKMFLSGLTAWITLTFTYFAAELHYTLLQSRMGALHIFILGAFSYGLIAVFQWVFLLCVRARQQHVSQTRRAATAAGRSRTR